MKSILRSLHCGWQARPSESIRASVRISAIVLFAVVSGCKDDPVTTAAVSDFSLTGAQATATATVAPGQAVQRIITIERTGTFSGNVTLSVSGLPAGATASLSPNPATSGIGAVVLSIAATVQTVPGSYAVLITGSASGHQNRTLTVELEVVTPAGATVSLNPVASSVSAGALVQSNISLTRVGGLLGDLVLTAENLPVGVTASFAPGVVSGNTSTVTFATSVGATTGIHQISVRATGVGGISVVAPFTLTITASQGFSVELAATSTSIAVGGTGTLAASVKRTGGFTGAVNLSVSGLAAGIAATVSPTAVTGASASLNINVAPNAAAGTYTGSLNANAIGFSGSSATFTIIVTAVAANTIRWEFCDPARLPLFFAFRDGETGPWTNVAQTGRAFEFTINRSVGSVAYVNTFGPGFLTTVRLLTKDELIATAALECTLFLGSGKTVSGVVSSLSQTKNAIVSLGGATGLPTLANPAFTLADVPKGSPDLVAARFALDQTRVTSAVDKIVLRRGLNLASGSMLAPIDFDGPEAFSPAIANVAVANVGSDQLAVQSAFNIFGANMGVIAPGVFGSANTREVYGVPPARLLADDKHLLTVTGLDGSGGVRTVTAIFHEIANQSIALAARLEAPTITISKNTVLRPRARGNFQADYQTQYGFGYTSATRNVVISTTRSYFASFGQYDLEVPDLTSVPGYNSSWGLIPGSPVTYVFSADNIPAGPPTVGTQLLSASRTGNVP